MIHPDTELRPVNDQIGLGVFATRPIARGSIVWVLDELDLRFSPERVRQLGKRYQTLLERFGYLNAQGERILCWDLARWINHSCEANVLSTGWDLDIAIRDIAAGEEITTDYGCLNLERSFRCHCGAPECRSTVYPDDFEQLAERWDASAQRAFADLRRVPQPLWDWIPDKRTVARALRDPRRLPSIRAHRFVAVPPAAPRRLAMPKA